MSVEDFEGVAPSVFAFGNVTNEGIVSNPNSSGSNTTANAVSYTHLRAHET